ncbi:universal stress protein [Nonomuraea endophytica]|uniref:Nucleotide-binding universal stress UspA family protein n=1 Tax=Nonomuraea endophytica TaxID=714136 RepID=A0A7W8A5P7_9ACTN|nr:universal stress protein [Nonomuraea endophytica]MBB5080009.1 nucleotide-binding universal stress UspA family protein [Nonomuraea endophytica]
MIGAHVIVGYTGDAGGRDALALGTAITQVTGGELTVATIYPPGSPGQAVEAQANLAHAAGELGERPAEYMAFESRGAGRGLAVLASRIKADLIVVGSADGGQHGRIAIGSTSDHLLHLSPEAVMLAPAGYRPPAEPTRLTLAYVHRPQCDEAVELVAQAALRLGVPLRLITLDLRTDDAGRLRDDLALAVRLAWEGTGIEAEAEIAEGYDVAAAIGAVEWPPGDLLVCASSEDAQAHRVFLGELAMKVLRASVCPVAVLPRGFN